MTTPEQIKNELYQQGLTLKDWAKQNGYKPNQVYRVMNGESKALYGIGHEIAIKLGLKSQSQETQDEYQHLHQTTDAHTPNSATAVQVTQPSFTYIGTGHYQPMPYRLYHFVNQSTQETPMADTVIRALKIIKVLAGQSLHGMTPSEIAKAIGDSNVNCHRSLQDLISEGFAVQYAHNQRYALSTACLAIATAYNLEMAQAQERIHSIQQRVNAQAHQYLD